MTVKNKKQQALCKFSDMEDLTTKGFEVKIKRKTTPIFIVRKDDQIYGYQNICPHAQAPLEWVPDQFLSENKDYIICAVHGAEFTIEEGACMGGPCEGIGLTPIDVEIIEDQIVLK